MIIISKLIKWVKCYIKVDVNMLTVKDFEKEIEDVCSFLNECSLGCNFFYETRESISKNIYIFTPPNLEQRCIEDKRYFKNLILSSLSSIIKLREDNDIVYFWVKEIEQKPGLFEQKTYVVLSEFNKKPKLL